MVEIGDALEQQTLDQHAEGAHGHRREEQRPPITDAEIGEQEPGAEGTQHVLGAVREVDDVEKPEDHREAERQDGVEGAVDEPDQELTEQHLRGDAEKLLHCRCLLRSAPASADHFTSGQLPSFSGRKAWSAGIVARRL
jgi:hypothetical protein